MIQFNELRITEDNKCLIIDVEIQDLSYFNNVTIDRIVVDTQDNYTQSGPSEKAITVYSSDMHDLAVIDQNGKHVRLEVTKPILNFCNNMYFVYAFANIYNAPEVSNTPCICNDDYEVGVVANLYPVYQRLMAGIKELGDTCNIPQNFINQFLQFQAVESSLQTGNYPMAVQYWNKFFNKGEEATKVVSKSCGCHGRY